MRKPPLALYQEEATRFTTGREYVGLFVFFGGGKTYIALDWLEQQERNDQNPFPALVLCDKGMTTQWEEQIREHTFFTCTPILDKAGKERASHIARAQTDIIAIHYDAVKRVVRKGVTVSSAVFDAIRAKKFRTVIVDESTALKNARSQRSLEIRELFKKTPYKAILSGVPITEGAEDIWAQMYFLDGGKALGTSYWKFREQYFTTPPPWRPYDWKLREGAAEQIAAAISDSCLYIPKDRVLAQLPEKRYIEVPIEMPPSLYALYKQMRDDFLIDLPSGETYETMWAPAKASKLRQIADGFMYRGEETEWLNTGKLDWLESNVPILVKNGPVLIWADFTAMQHAACATLDHLKLPYAAYLGEAEQREHARKQFVNGEVDVMVLSQNMGYRGLDLWRANQAIFLDNSYKGEVRPQAEDRCHRQGSQIHTSVTYYDLLRKRSLDKPILDAVRKKQDVAKAILKHLLKGDM